MINNLAIFGHLTRGENVIEILEMLGGKNVHNLTGNRKFAYYIIDSNKEIKGGSYIFGDEDCIFLTVEESQKVRAPEDMTGWWEISDELGIMLNEFDDIPKLLRRILIPEWKLKLFSIFSTQSLDEIKNEIYG
jgi:hypothetical protein